MNQYIIIAIVFVVLIIFWMFSKNFIKGGVKINYSDVKKRLETEKDIILLDVRNPDEYIQRHIPNSTLIPVNILASEAGKKLTNKDADIFVYCASGNRSSQASNILSKMGYKKVYNMGGIYNWPYETVSGNK